MVICDFCGKGVTSLRKGDHLVTIRIFKDSDKDWDGTFPLRASHVCDSCQARIVRVVRKAVNDCQRAVLPKMAKGVEEAHAV